MDFRRIVFALTNQTMVQARNSNKTNGKRQRLKRSHTEVSDEEGSRHAQKSDHCFFFNQSLDDSLTPAAGWSWTGTHTASMLAPSLNLANHLTHMVLDLGCTHETIEGVGLIASLVSWHNTPFIQPRSCNSTSPHMFRGCLTIHKGNGESKLTSCSYTC